MSSSLKRNKLACLLKYYGDDCPGGNDEPPFHYNYEQGNVKTPGRRQSFQTIYKNKSSYKNKFRNNFVYLHEKYFSNNFNIDTLWKGKNLKKCQNSFNNPPFITYDYDRYPLLLRKLHTRVLTKEQRMKLA